MLVSDFMNRNPIKIDKDQNLKDALNLMEKRKVSRLLVVEGDKLVGVITFRDIMEILGSKKYARVSPTSLHVSMAMTKNPITITEDSDIRKARDLMLGNNISTLPVVRGNKLVGIITKMDLLKPLINSEESIHKIIRTNVITINPKSRLIHARKIMLEKNIGRLIVMDNEELVGIITDKDIAKAFYKLKTNISEKYYDESVKKLLVEDFMTQNVITIRHDYKIGDCVKIMSDKKISGLPVIKNDKLYGIITKTDIIRLL